MNRWYQARNRQRVGPYTLEELRGLVASGVLQPSDMVLPEGGQNWVASSTIQGLYPSVPSVPEPVAIMSRDRLTWPWLAGGGAGLLLLIFALASLLGGKKPKEESLATPVGVPSHVVTDKGTATGDSMRGQQPDATASKSTPDEKPLSGHHGSKTQSSAS